MLVAAADPSVPSYYPCQASGMGNCFEAGGTLKFGLGDAPPAALWCIGVNPGATRSDKATHPSPGARRRAGVLPRLICNPLHYRWHSVGDTRLGDRESIIANPGKVSAGVFSIKKLPEVIRVFGHHSGPCSC